MKYLIISDLHLTTRFNQEKFLQLKALFESVDRLIINGDFYESYVCTFNQFYHSKWSQLFPLMKEKKAIYLCGNHDEMDEVDERVFSFCDVHDIRYTLNGERTTYYIEHGHRITGDSPLQNKYLRRIKYFLSYLELPTTIFMHGWAQKITSWFDIKNLKTYARENMKKNEVLICGHVHVAENNAKYQYINTGFSRFHYLQYFVISDSE